MTFFCYGTGDGAPPADLELVRVPRRLSPRALRAGPAPGKPLADLLLARSLVSAQRRRPFDAALAHNAEAALAALAARAVTGLPVVYVVHTLFGAELDAYAPRPLAAAARALGETLDRRLAGSADAVLALCRDAASHLAPHVRRPLALVPPGLDPGPEPEPARVAEVCARHGVEPGGFALYTGNVDRYQDLELLAETARRVPELPLLVATHGERRFDDARVRSLRVSPDEARALTFGCAAALLPRRRAGGFPVKLLNYMEAARPVVARRGIADGLVHDCSACLVPREAGPAEFAAALRRLRADPAYAARLGRGARAALEENHAWPPLARRTLELAGRARAGRLRHMPV